MLTIRTATSEDALAIAKVHVETWRSTYRGLIPADYLAGLSIPKRQEFWEELLRTLPARSHVFVTSNAHNEVVGFISGGPNRSEGYAYDGEVAAIYLLEAYQGQGLGKRLFQASIDRLAQDAFQSMLVWVLEGNRASFFYEAMGGRLLAEKFESIGGEQLKELAYAWDNLAGRVLPQRIYHITDRAAWLRLESPGVYEDPSLKGEGFIHCSDRHQVLGVANRYFHGQSERIILEMDASKLRAELIYESSSGGTELFPHIYGPINREAVLLIHHFPCEADGAFRTLPSTFSPGS